MSTPDPAWDAATPYAQAHAALCVDLAQTLPLAEGLASILGETATSAPAEPGQADHTALVTDVATTLDLPASVDEILDVEGGYARLLADLTSSIDITAGLASILDTPAPTPTGSGPAPGPTATPEPTESTPRRARRRWRAGLIWLTSGTAVAAAAVVLALGAQTSTPVQAPDQTGSTTNQAGSNDSSGRQVLLTAADVAQAQPNGKGAYWHTKETSLDPVNNIWVAGEYWISPNGNGFHKMSTQTVAQAIVQPDFQVGGTRLTFAKLQQLPTDPTALTQWLANSFTGTGRPDVPGDVAFSLTRLLWEVPAPPAVRAAAFRAFAAMPNVTNLGPQDSGTALRIAVPAEPADKHGGKVPEGSDHLTIVVDQKTGTVLSYTNYQGTVKFTEIGWTNNAPNNTQPLPSNTGPRPAGPPGATPTPANS